ncbi:MAG: hypothetical protein WCG98_02755 [bacterium]
MIGISLIDLRINIDKKISTNTMTSINTMTHKTLVELDTLEYIFCTIPDTIDAKISKDTQLEIPFSVINSPNHIRNTDPTVMTTADNNTLGKVVEITFPPSI